MCLVCMFLLLTEQSAMAASEGGAEPFRDGQTDVMTGVVVDYMGKLQYLVTDQSTKNPIPGASVEIYIPSLDRYVLFGVTDANGILELDVAYGERTGQFVESGGQTVFPGTTLFLKDNNIAYRAYKSDWLPYPYEGTTVLETREVPQIITIALYKHKGGGGGGGSSSGGGSGENTVTFPIGPSDVPLVDLAADQTAGGIPKTGVEGTMQYWIAGLLFFLIAGGLVALVLRYDKVEYGRKRQKTEEE